MELLHFGLLELGVADRFRHDLRRVTLPWYPVDKAGADLQPVPKALEMLEGFLRLEHALLQRHVLTVVPAETRSEEHTSELQSLMRISYAAYCMKTHLTQN